MADVPKLADEIPIDFKLGADHVYEKFKRERNCPAKITPLREAFETLPRDVLMQIEIKD